MAGIKTYAITGIPMPAKPDPQHPIPLRKEVTAWASDPDNAVQLSLFIQALIKFQQMPLTDKLSYYQVAGIHGYPATSWDGADTPTSGADGSSWYCNHNKTTFPTWHRPYMLLFEQRLYEIMTQTIVPTVTPASEQSIWAIEASHWRLPYWDWAATQPYLQNVGIPQLFTQQTISITMPNNKHMTVKNPLWSFRCPDGKALGDQSKGEWAVDAQPWSNTIGTSRHAQVDGRGWVQGLNNFRRANLSIQAHQWYINEGDEPNYAISDLVSRLFSDDYLKSWRSFSCTLHQGEAQGQVPAPTDYLSLEYIHNNIHSFTGGGAGGSDGDGHMEDPGVASFDPIFFLHHCNVDRQLAMWQALNPSKWFDNLDPTDATNKTRLSPFHKDTKGTIYTSDDCRDWTKLNYQYDVLENTPRWIRAETHASKDEVTDDHIAGHVRRTVNLHCNKTRHAVLASPDLKGAENDYLVNVVYDRYALSGKPYSVHFFIGHVPDDLEEGCTYQDLSSYVGSLYTFSSPLELSGAGKCQSCIEQKKAGVLSKGQIVLTTKLIGQANNPDIADINSLDREEVERYLAHSLTWKAVEAVTGRVVSIEELPKTKVYVMAGEAQHFEDPGRMSRYGGYGHLWRPTEGKAGGAVEADQGRHMAV